jgi:hypothetical protein
MNLAHDLSSERILDLLTELSMDPFAQEALARDPSATLARAGLSAEEQRALTQWLQRGPARSERSASSFFFDPGDDPDPNPDPPETRPCS